MKTYSVGIIGLGKIAAMYGKPDEANPYCHVGGIRHSQRVRLTAVAEMFAPAREKFQATWGASFPELAYHETPGALYAAGVPDIIAVCVRGPAHFAVTMEALAAGPKVIFLEKPPSCSLAEQDLLVAEARRRGIPIMVSYSRHWRPVVLRLAELVRGGLIGDLKMVVTYPGHQVLSFASHATDLLCQFAGYQATEVYARGRLPTGSTPPGYEVEPLLDSLQVTFANGVVGVQLGVAGEYNGFYAEVFGTQGYVRAGMYIPPYARDAKGQPIDLSAHGLPAEASVFQVAYEQAAAWLDGGPLPECSNEQFMMVNEIGFAAIESIHRHQPIAVPCPYRQRVIHANG